MKKLLLFLCSIACFQGYSQSEPVYSVVEQQPDFPGGTRALYDYIRSNLVYPKEDIKKQIQGKVFTSFIVEKNGQLSDITILKSLTYDCGQEAVRLLESMPLWRPGKTDGRIVRVKYNLPIEFKLGNRFLEESDEAIYQDVDRTPKFLGNLENYILDNMVYPQQAIQRNIQGVVAVSLIVEKDGSLSNIRIVSGLLSYGCNEEAVRLVRAMPQWSAGEINGRKVRTESRLSILFSIENHKLYSKEYARFRRF